MDTRLKQLIGAFLLSISFSSNAVEGFMCKPYFDDTQRQAKNLAEQQTNLSSIAKQKLIDDLIFNIKECISNCEGSKFKFCNSVAKKLENK